MKINDYISISQYAEIKGITPQAVYKKLNSSLNNEFTENVIEYNGKKYIHKRVLTEEEQIEVETKLKDVEQPKDNNFQQFNNQIQLFFQQQIEEKDSTIKSLLSQIENLQKQNQAQADTIREQSLKLSEHLNNSQILLLNQQNILLNEKKKKGIFGLFKKRETADNETN